MRLDDSTLVYVVAFENTPEGGVECGVMRNNDSVAHLLAMSIDDALINVFHEIKQDVTPMLMAGGARVDTVFTGDPEEGTDHD